MTRNDANHMTRVAVLSALSLASADPGRLVEVLAAAEDDEDATGRLREAYEFTAVQAQAVLDAQFRLLTRARRAAVDVELRDVRDALAAPWDPPLHVPATVHPPQHADVLIAGVTHRVEGEDLHDCLERVAALVRTQLARPQRRRVAVSTGLTDGPARILVDPAGSAEFLYDDDGPG